MLAPEPDGDLVDADGNSYHVITLGSGPPVFFLHGGGPGCTAWTDFAVVAPLFAEHYTCYLIDLLQYGKSEKCTISGPMWDAHAASIVALMSTLNVERADFICNSWGGTIALRHVHPLNVAGFIAIKSGCYYWPGAVLGALCLLTRSESWSSTRF